MAARFNRLPRDRFGQIPAWREYYIDNPLKPKRRWRADGYRANAKASASAPPRVLSIDEVRARLMARRRWIK